MPNYCISCWQTSFNISISKSSLGSQHERWWPYPQEFFKSILPFSVGAGGIYLMSISCSLWTLDFCSISLGVFNRYMKGKVVSGIKASKIFIWQLSLIWVRIFLLSYYESYHLTASPFIFPHLHLIINVCEKIWYNVCKHWHTASN